MLNLVAFLFHTFPLIIAWLYLLVAAFVLGVHMKQIKRKIKISVGQWIFAVFNSGYILFFLITRIFFAELWENVFSVSGLMALFILVAWSRYDDRRRGRRWWNW